MHPEDSTQDPRSDSDSIGDYRGEEVEGSRWERRRWRKRREKGGQGRASDKGFYKGLRRGEKSLGIVP